MILPVVPAIVLAAGQSSRMGRLKANLPVTAAAGADTFLSHIVRTFLAAGIDDVIVVVGHEKEAVLAGFDGRALSVRFVDNPDYASGQLSSLLAGLRVIDHPGVVATLVTLVDVPFASAATVRAVVDRYRATRAPVVRPSRAGRHGHPFLVDRVVFDKLRRANPAAGARPVIRSYASAAGDVEVEDEGAFADVDTPEEYASALRIFGAALEAPRGRSAP
jgi:molybdenum cofactor cytidylyltransferase